jgi:geranylgeranyl pyrophosphate synthase
VLTLPAILALESGRATSEISSFMLASPGDRPRLLAKAYRAICGSGALERSRAVADDYLSAATNSLDSLPDSAARDSLSRLVGFIRNKRF